MARKLWATTAIVLGSFSVATACGPDFPWQLLSNRSATLGAAPANSFAFEATHLMRATDALKANEAMDTREVQGADAFADPRAEEIYRSASELFLAGAYDDASERFARFLELPETATRDHRLRALYSLGRSRAGSNDPTGAIQAFQDVRAAALGGLDDRLGLAVASYGEEAKVHFLAAQDLFGDDPPSADAAPTFAREIAAAAELYAAQAARGSASGTSSLRMVAEYLLELPERVAVVIDQPLIQRLLVAYVIRRTDLNNSASWLNEDEHRIPEAAQSTPLQVVAAALKMRDLANATGADRLAILAYRTGQFDLARTLAARTDTALGHWVRAKLAVQNYDFKAAAAEYASAVEAVAKSGDLEADNNKRLAGESAVVELLRSDYTQSFSILWPYADSYWGDITYVAERVLTVRELEPLIAKYAPIRTPPRGPDQELSASQKLRALFARRLMREGRFEIALRYFDDPGVRDKAKTYASALQDERSGRGPAQRASALWDAALLARESGMDILGFEGPPDFAVVAGSYGFGYGQEKPGKAYVSFEERARVQNSEDTWDSRRYHYRYIAASLARDAAGLAPPRSQAYAALLCRATGWMLQTEGGLHIARDLYRQYVAHGAYVPWGADFGKHCPDPDFDASFRPVSWGTWVNSHLPGRLKKWFRAPG